MDSADKMLDKTRLSFGKHKGLSPEDVARVDPGYIVWLYEAVEPKRCSRGLALDCESALHDIDAERFYDNRY